MRLRERYSGLTLWNKLSAWGALASVVAIPLSIFLFLAQCDRSDPNRDTIPADDKPEVMDAETNDLASATKIDRFPPTYGEVTGKKPRLLDMDAAERLDMALSDFLGKLSALRESGNFAAHEDFKAEMDGKWIDWAGTVLHASSVGGMGWDYDVTAQSGPTKYGLASLPFYGQGWGSKVLSLRKGDTVRFSGRIHQVGSDFVSLNIADIEIVLQPQE